MDELGNELRRPLLRTAGRLGAGRSSNQLTPNATPMPPGLTGISFGKRTGHGDLKTAQKWAEDYLPANETRPDLADQQMAAYFYWLSGSPKKALDLFGKLFAANSLPGTGVNLALIADELGDKARRETVLEELWHQAAKPGTQDGQSLPDDDDELADASHHPFDMAAVDRVLESIPEDGRGNAEFVVGRYLLNRGKADLAGEIPEVLCRFAHRQGQAGWPPGARLIIRTLEVWPIRLQKPRRDYLRRRVQHEDHDEVATPAGSAIGQARAVRLRVRRRNPSRSSRSRSGKSEGFDPRHAHSFDHPLKPATWAGAQIR